MDDEKFSNRARVAKETTVRIEWMGRVDNSSKGRCGGRGGGVAWWRYISYEADDKNAHPPWEFDDEEQMEEIQVMMGVGVGAAAAVANAADPHQHDVNAKVRRKGTTTTMTMMTRALHAQWMRHLMASATTKEGVSLLSVASIDNAP